MGKYMNYLGMVLSMQVNPSRNAFVHLEHEVVSVLTICIWNEGPHKIQYIGLPASSAMISFTM